MISIPPAMHGRLLKDFGDRPEIAHSVSAAVMASGAPPDSLRALVVGMDWMIAKGHDKTPLFHGVYGNGLNQRDDRLPSRFEKRVKLKTYLQIASAEANLLVHSTFTTASVQKPSTCRFNVLCRSLAKEPEQDQERFGALVVEACRSGAIYHVTSLSPNLFSPTAAFPHIPLSFFRHYNMVGCPPAVLPHLDRLLDLDLACLKKAPFTQVHQYKTLARGERLLRSEHDEIAVAEFAIKQWNDWRVERKMPLARPRAMSNVVQPAAAPLLSKPVAVNDVMVWDDQAATDATTEDAMGACEIARLLLSGNGTKRQPNEFHTLCKHLAVWLRGCTSSRAMADILVAIGRHMEASGSTDGAITGPSKHLRALGGPALPRFVREHVLEEAGGDADMTIPE